MLPGAHETRETAGVDLDNTVTGLETRNTSETALPKEAGPSYKDSTKMAWSDDKEEITEYVGSLQVAQASNQRLFPSNKQGGACGVQEEVLRSDVAEKSHAQRDRGEAAGFKTYHSGYSSVKSIRGHFPHVCADVRGTLKGFILVGLCYISCSQEPDEATACLFFRAAVEVWGTR